ncbi:hypothetical protein KQX64_07035 [Rhodopseudomonas palustris]|nr:hypothetical protein KQX64_07035 [Rhodopseudomonas palustris]
MRPVLLYVRKINGHGYGREEHSARAVAEIAGLPFRVVEARLSGKSAHIENPVKNLLLMAAAAEYAIRFGAGIVALGALEHDGENARNFGCGLSDDPGLIERGAEAIAAVVPGFRGIAALHRNDADAYARVWHSLPAAIPAVGSCMTGPRAHRSTREANQRKFGVDLLPGRCGSCYKCAFELITTAALSGEALPAPLADHCVAKLRAGLRMIRGAEALPSVADALDAFFDVSVFDHMPALANARLK